MIHRIKPSRLRAWLQSNGDPADEKNVLTSWHNFVKRETGTDGGLEDVTRRWLRIRGATGEKLSELWASYLTRSGFAGNTDGARSFFQGGVGGVLSGANWYIDANAYDSANDRLTDLSGGGNHATLGSGVGADSNDPAIPSYNGTKYVWFPNIAGEHVTTPDHASVDITGDIDIRVDIDPVSWTPASHMNVISKFEATGGQRSYQFGINTAGTLRLVISGDGAATTTYTSSAATGFATGTRSWIRVTLDVDNGATNSAAFFYTSTDGVNWTQLGTERNSGGVVSIFNGTDSLRVGGLSSSSPYGGKIYRAQVYSGIAGTKVADFYPQGDTISTAHTTITSASDGKVWTVNRTATGVHTAIVDEAKAILGTDDYFNVADNATLDFAASQDFTIAVAFRSHDVSDEFYPLVKISSTLADGWMMASLGGTPFFSTIASTVASTAVGAAVTDGQRIIMVARRISGTEMSVWINGVEGALTETNTNFNCNNALPMRVGALSGGTVVYTDFEFMGAAIFRRALSDTEVTRVTTEMSL